MADPTHRGVYNGRQGKTTTRQEKQQASSYDGRWNAIRSLDSSDRFLSPHPGSGSDPTRLKSRDSQPFFPDVHDTVVINQRSRIGVSITPHDRQYCVLFEFPRGYGYGHTPTADRTRTAPVERISDKSRLTNTPRLPAFR